MGEKTNALVSFTSVSGAQDWSFVLNKEGPWVGQDINPSGQSGLRIKYLPSILAFSKCHHAQGFKWYIWLGTKYRVLLACAEPINKFKRENHYRISRLSGYPSIVTLQEVQLFIYQEVIVKEIAVKGKMGIFGSMWRWAIGPCDAFHSPLPIFFLQLLATDSVEQPSPNAFLICPPHKTTLSGWSEYSHL